MLKERERDREQDIRAREEYIGRGVGEMKKRL